MIVAAALLAARGAVARDAGRWGFGPAPAWLAPEPPASATPPPADESVLEYPLDDTQTRVSPGAIERYHHVKFRPRTAAQVEEGSQIELQFDPAHERLVIHAAGVVRDGRVVSKLARRDVRILQREPDLEQRIYDEGLTAVVFLADVRVGDVIDYAYTVVDGAPLLGPKFVARFAVADETFTTTWRQRILLPAARELTVKAHGIDLPPKTAVSGGWREYLWERSDLAPVEAEDGVPRWFEAAPWIEVSELSSWGEVARLFERFYPTAAPRGALAALVAKLRAGRRSDEERLLEATRFVQDEVRYLGIELGIGGFKPFEPSVVLGRRFGDCKDKAFLLVTLLRALGFDARPALVNTRRVHGLDQMLPSTEVFDHAIVEVVVGGSKRFIDPTSSYERGPLAQRQPPDFERALVVAADTEGLTVIPRPALDEPSVAVRETITVPDGGEAADMEVETTYRFDEANSMRARLVGSGRRELGRSYLNYYAGSNPSVTQTRELEAVDDERRNVLVVRERYHFGEFWRDSVHDVQATTLTDRLAAPRIRLRHMPYALDFPLYVTHVVSVRLPAAPVVPQTSRELADDHVRFSFSERLQDTTTLVLRYELRTLADAVAPEKAARFFSVLDGITDVTGYRVHRPSGSGRPRSSWFEDPMLAVFLPAFGVVVLGAGGVWALRFTRSRRRRNALRARHAFASGEAPATAIEIRSEAEIARIVAGLSCACGARYAAAPDDGNERVTYGERTLLAHRARCPACGKTRSVFFSCREA
jgi:transglutaminase-like putative cysteine protease